MTKFATGGYVKGHGAGTAILFERLGQCVHGFCIYALNGEPQHIISPKDSRADAQSKATCPCGGKVVRK